MNNSIAACDYRSDKHPVERIEQLERENAQLKAVIKEQKETIELLNNACSVYSKRCEEQTELIECLYTALHCGWIVGATEFDAKQLANEAFISYAKWREGK